MKAVNRSALAKTFNVSLQTVDRWVARGCPHKRTGKGYVFDIEQVKAWQKKYQRSLQKEDPDYQAAKLKHKQEQARALEIMNLVKLKKLCNAQEMQRVIERDYTDLKKSLYNMIHRLPPLLTEKKEPDIFETLKGELDDCLTQFVARR